MTWKKRFSALFFFFFVLSTTIKSGTATSELAEMRSAVASMQESLLTSLRLVQDQMDQLGSNTLEKIVSRFDVLEEEFVSMSESLVHLEERARIWDALQLHVSAWSDLMSSMDSKIDHLDRSQREHFRSQHELLVRLEQRVLDLDSRQEQQYTLLRSKMGNQSDLIRSQMDQLFELNNKISIHDQLNPSQSNDEFNEEEDLNSNMNTNAVLAILEEMEERQKQLANFTQILLTTDRCFEMQKIQKSETKFKTTIINNDSSSIYGKATNCKDLLIMGESGVYDVATSNSFDSKVLCDQETEGGGWTVIMRRGRPYSSTEALLSFNRSWSEYSEGFGNLEEEFYFGNSNIEKICTVECLLRVHLTDQNGLSAKAVYDGFRLGNESDNYRLHLTSFIEGDAGDSLMSHNKELFSTPDKTNDKAPSCCPCAKIYGGGWWFHNCFDANLNGPLDSGDSERLGIVWSSWRGHQGLSSAQMMIRPRDF